MSKWKFILVNRDEERIEVPQPINWTNPEIKISRENQFNWHGVFFDYGVDKLTFDDLGAAILKTEYESYGANGFMKLDIQYQCSEDNRYDSLYEGGNLAFDQYEDTCGDECIVTIAVEDSNDIMQFRNNYEQDVDLNSNISFDQETTLDNYNYLNFDLQIPTRGLPIKSNSTNDTKYTFFVDNVIVPPAISSVYSVNSSEFTISSVSISNGSGSIGAILTEGVNFPPASGSIAKISGIGDDIIDFSSFETSNGFSLLDFPGWFNISAPGTTGTENGGLMPVFGTVGLTEIDSTNINSAPYYDTNIRFNAGDNSVGTPPFIDLADNLILRCSPDQLSIKFLIEGRLIDRSFASRIVTLAINVRVGQDASNTSSVMSQMLADYESNDPGKITDFSVSFEGVQPLIPGDKIYVYLYITYVKTSSASIQNLRIDFYNKNFIEFSGVSYCDTTISKSSLINESISRTSEAITNNELKFYSEFFGRLDSQPYATGTNSCAGLMAITNGLNMRRKLLQDGTRPGFFINMKKLFDGLNAIWNIGLTIEPDKNRPGFNCLRFEKWTYFYQNEIGVTFRYATKINRKVDPVRIFNKITVGYNKWEAEGSTGLYELMTTRTYRVNINSTSKELNISSDFVCSPYTIEITRRLDQTTQDWKYDNDIFALCLKADPYSVETFLDSATSISNVVDSNTAYNGRITPVRNLMRWFNYIMQSFRQLKVDSKLIFSSGTGNYIARLKMNNCAIEGKTMAENEDIDLGDFNDIQDAKPITFPELVEFEHPMNYQTFKRFKDDPTLRYKSVEYYCNGTAFQGWIDEISYRPEEGMANITVIPKNNLQLPGPPDTACHATIVPGSLVITECGDNCRQFDFTEGNPGATFWYYLVTKGTVPAQGEGFSATTPEHPFTVDGLTPGDWSIYIVPYCDLENIGENYAAATFNIPLPAFSIELSAILTTGRQPYNKLQLTAQSNVAVSQGFQFKFGQCCTNTSTGVNTCSGFPGATIPPPQAPPGTMSFNTGDAQKMAESGYSTPGADFGTITKVVIYDLQGIEPSQITKAAGQTWALEFQ